MYRILSIDGGGIRGLFAARILSRLAGACPDIIEQADLIAGTSAGAIIAVGLAKGLAPNELVDLFRQKSGEIFRATLLHELGDLWGLIGAKYGSQSRWLALYPLFGETTIGELKKKVFVSTFDLGGTPDVNGSRQWRARFFHNLDSSSQSVGARAIDVVMRSSAAPTYFPIYQNSIDGGVVANNPSMCALAQAMNMQPSNGRPNKISLLSIGTGIAPKFVDSENGDWGLEQWGFKLIDLLLEAGGGLADYQCRQLLGPQYLRINPQLPAPIGLDDISKIDQLIEIADSVPLAPLVDWLNEFWFGLDGTLRSAA